MRSVPPVFAALVAATTATAVADPPSPDCAITETPSALNVSTVPVSSRCHSGVRMGNSRTWFQ